MRAPAVWDLVLLVGNAAAFGWRTERWSNGDAGSGAVAVVFAVVTVALAYRIWRLSHE